MSSLKELLVRQLFGICCFQWPTHSRLDISWSWLDACAKVHAKLWESQMLAPRPRVMRTLHFLLSFPFRLPMRVKANGTSSWSTMPLLLSFLLEGKKIREPSSHFWKRQAFFIFKLPWVHVWNWQCDSLSFLVLLAYLSKVVMPLHHDGLIPLEPPAKRHPFFLELLLVVVFYGNRKATNILGKLWGAEVSASTQQHRE